MSRELRALRQRHGLARADPTHTLSARIPAPAQTLDSVATQGRCGGEEQQVVAAGVVSRKSCLKRRWSVSRGGDSGAAKRVSFASQPQVRVMSPPSVVEELGRQRGGEKPPGAEAGVGERRRPRRTRFSGGYSVLAGAAAPVRRSMRNAVNFGVRVEQVTVAVSNSVKFEEEDDAEETVDRKRKRKSRENSEHMVVSAQIGVSRRSTRSSGLLSEAPFVSPPAVEKKRARRKGLAVKEQTLEEQPAKQENRRQPTKPATRSNSYQELTSSSVEEEYQEQIFALCKALPLRRSSRNHSKASAQIGVSRRSTKSSGLLSEAPFVSPPAVEKKRARRKGPAVKEQTLEEQPSKLENRRQPTKPATRSNSYQELASSSVEEEYQEQVFALCKALPLRRSSRNHSKASGLLLNNNTSSESSNCTRAREEGNEVKIACLSAHNAAKDDTKEGMSKEDGHLELPWNEGAKDCAGMEEQMVQIVVRKGCLKRSGADVSSGSSGVAKKVTFKLVEQAAAEVAGFRRPWVVPDEEAGSDALLRWSRRNAVNFGAGDGVEKIAGAVSRNITANADDDDEEHVGEAVDRNQKASENVEDIGYVWLMPIIATTNFSQIVAATKSAANKMATKVVANFGKKLSLYHVDHGANKVGQAAVVAMDQIDA